MFDHMSRYYPLATASLSTPDGNVVTYVTRRFLPQGATLPLMFEVAVMPGDRIDLLANRVYGDPLAFWRICDANDAMDPRDMLNEAAADLTRRLRAPLPQA